MREKYSSHFQYTVHLAYKFDEWVTALWAIKQAGYVLYKIVCGNIIKHIIIKWYRLNHQISDLNPIIVASDNIDAIYIISIKWILRLRAATQIKGLCHL